MICFHALRTGYEVKEKTGCLKWNKVYLVCLINLAKIACHLGLLKPCDEPPVKHKMVRRANSKK